MLSDGITKEYQRLEQLGGYSDAAEVQLNLVRWVLEIAVRLEALEAKLGPLAEAVGPRQPAGPAPWESEPE